MNKREIINSMEKYTKASFITRKQLAEFLGRKSQYHVDKYLVGLDRIDKMYFIPDVAARLMEFMNTK